MLSTLLLGVSSVAYANDRTINSHICASGPPILLSPVDGSQTTNSTAVASGTTLVNTPVTIKSNGNAVAWTTSAGDGTFSVGTPLVLGTNTITAEVTNTCSVLLTSNAATITRNALPPPPTPTPTPAPAPAPQPAPTPLPVVTPPSSPVVETPPIDTPPTTTPVNPDTPVIERPKDGSTTDDGKTTVSGQAKPFSVVEIIVNSEVVAKVIASEDGTFTAQVPLKSGSNKVQARVLAANDVRLISDLLTITYQEKKPDTASADKVKGGWLDWALLALSIIFVGLLFLIILGKKRKKSKEEETDVTSQLPPPQYPQ